MHLYDSDLLGRLFIMLKYFPIESKGRQTKAERGRQSCQHMFLLFLGTMHNGKDFCPLEVVQV